LRHLKGMCLHHMKLANNVLLLILPGQIELFTHVPVVCNFVEHLKRKNFNVCVVYLLDSQICISVELFVTMKILNWKCKTRTGLSLFLWVQFIPDVTKCISGCMASLSAMIQLEPPHINILSKMDLLVISWVDK
jgi:GPN-loop GTPase